MPRESTQESPLSLSKAAIAVALVALAYFLTALVGRIFTPPGSSISTIWPSVGVALALLLVLPRIALLGVFIGSAAAICLLFDGSVRFGMIAAGGTMLYLAIARGLLRHKGFQVQTGKRLPEVLAFYWVVALCVLIGAMIGSFAKWMEVYLGPGVEAWRWGEMLGFWWLGDMTGLLIVTPLLLVWRNEGLSPPRYGRLSLSLLALGVVCSLTATVFMVDILGDNHHSPLAFTIFPFVIVVALRCGPRTNATMSALIAAIAITGTQLGHGPFSFGTEEFSKEATWSLGLFLLAVKMVEMTISTARTGVRGTAASLALRSKLLGEVAEISRRFLEVKTWGQGAQEMVERLGAAVGTSRCYVFENFEEEGDSFSKKRFEWCAEGIDEEIANPDLQALPLELPMLEPITRSLRLGRSFASQVEDLGGDLKSFFQDQGIIALLLVPIVVNGRWWGLLGFDECAFDRQWQQEELDAIELAAGVLAGTLGRDEAVLKMRQSEERFRSLTEQSEDLVLIFKPGEGVTYVSPQVQRVTGVGLVGLREKRRSDFVDEEDLERLAPLFAKAMQSPGQSVPIPEFQLRNLYGQTLWHEGTITNFMHLDEVEGIVVNLRDVSKRRDEHMLLEQSEERLRTFMEVSEEAIWYFELDEPVDVNAPLHDLVRAQWGSKLLECNRPYAKDYGRAPDDLIGTRYRDMSGFDRDVQFIDQVFQDFVTNGFRIDRLQTKETMKDGRERRFIKSAQGVVRGGKLIGTWGTSSDVTDRVHADMALKQAQTRFQSFSENTEDAIWYFEYDTPIDPSLPVDEQTELMWQANLVDCNEAFCDFFAPGKTRKDLIGKRYTDFHLYPDDTKTEIFKKIVAEDYQLSSEEVESRLPDGSSRLLSASTQGILEGGKVIGIWGIAADLSERQKKEIRFRKLAEHAFDGVVIYDEEGLIIDALGGIEKVAGYQEHEILGKDGNEFCVPEEADYVNAKWEEVLANPGKPISFTQQVPHRRGGVRWVEAVITNRLDDPFVNGIVSNFRDVTLRKSHETRFRKVIENAFDGALVYNSQGVIVDAYGAIEDVCGYSAREIIGRSGPETFFFEEDADEMWAIWERVLASPGTPISFKQRILHLEGRTVWVQVTLTNMLKEASIEGVVSNFRDVTEEHEAEEQMREAQKLESLGVMAGGIAHDFNNLILAILGNANLLSSKAGDPSRSGQHLANIESAAQRAAGLCQQMLTYAGKAQPQVHSLCLSARVREMAEILEVSVAKRARLELKLDDALPMIDADSAQITQIVMNLITNAAESIEHDQGLITLTTSSDFVEAEMLKQFSSATALEADEYVRLCIEDNGQGMDEQTRSRLFEPFFTTKFSGRGLGMAATMGIIRGHGGAIAVQSEVGSGTSISVIFPIGKQSPSQELKLKELTPTPDLAGLRVLVVDDDEFIRELAKEILELIPIGVVLASSGQESVDIYRDQGPFDLVLMDMTMPGMDGAEASRQILDLDPTAKLLISSGYSEAALSQRLESLNEVALIPKPYAIEDLTERVIKMVSKK